jgi:hypothetical protein
MTQYQDIQGSRAEWAQPVATERRFELRTGEGLAGVLHFRSLMGTLAAAENATGRWTYKRVGFFNTRVTVRVEGASRNLAVFKPNLWGRGVLRFADGAPFGWRSTSMWNGSWALTGAGDRPLIHFRSGLEERKLRDAFKIQAMVTIEEGAPRDDRLFVLLCFGMYMLNMHHEDNAAVIAASVT